MLEEKFEKILTSEKPSRLIKENEEYFFNLIPDLKKCKGFNQNNRWHIYDVYEHTLHVMDGVPKDLTYRLAALFHDLGKPYAYTEDKDGIGHFYKHWVKSNEIFKDFAQQNELDEKMTNTISKLIAYHDINLGKINKEEEEKIANIFSKEELLMLFKLKRSDLLAQNPLYHNMLKDYHEQEDKLLKEYYKKDEEYER